jgi:hypothetical protein
MEDKDLIINLGGPAKVAQLLGYGKWGTNRVSNWMKRGIPAAVKIDFPDLFLRPNIARKAPLSGTKEAEHA